MTIRTPGGDDEAIIVADDRGDGIDLSNLTPTPTTCVVDVIQDEDVDTVGVQGKDDEAVGVSGDIARTVRRVLVPAATLATVLAIVNPSLSRNDFDGAGGDSHYRKHPGQQGSGGSGAGSADAGDLDSSGNSLEDPLCPSSITPKIVDFSDCPDDDGECLVRGECSDFNPHWSPDYRVRLSGEMTGEMQPTERLATKILGGGMRVTVEKEGKSTEILAEGMAAITVHTKGSVQVMLVSENLLSVKAHEGDATIYQIGRDEPIVIEPGDKNARTFRLDKASEFVAGCVVSPGGVDAGSAPDSNNGTVLLTTGLVFAGLVRRRRRRDSEK